MSDWHDIETAPRDGTQLLLYTPARRLPNGYMQEAAMLVAWWDPHAWAEEDKENSGAFVAPLSDGFERNVTDHFAAPTHWAILPSPPSGG